MHNKDNNFWIPSCFLLQDGGPTHPRGSPRPTDWLLLILTGSALVSTPHQTAGQSLLFSTDHLTR